MSMDLRGQVWKLVRIMTFCGLKWGQNLENRAAHPYQEFPGVPPREPGALSLKFRQLPGPKNCCCLVKIKVSILLQKKWSVSKSKWTGFLAGTLTFILQIFIWTSVSGPKRCAGPKKRTPGSTRQLYAHTNCHDWFISFIYLFSNDFMFWFY